MASTLLKVKKDLKAELHEQDLIRKQFNKLANSLKLEMGIEVEEEDEEDEDEEDGE